MTFQVEFGDEAQHCVGAVLFSIAGLACWCCLRDLGGTPPWSPTGLPWAVPDTGCSPEKLLRVYTSAASSHCTLVGTRPDACPRLDCLFPILPSEKEFRDYTCKPFTLFAFSSFFMPLCADMFITAVLLRGFACMQMAYNLSGLLTLKIWMPG